MALQQAEPVPQLACLDVLALVLPQARQAQGRP